MPANGSGFFSGDKNPVRLHGQGPFNLDIPVRKYLKNIVMMGDGFQFSEIGQQLLSISIKAVPGGSHIPYQLQIYNVNRNKVDAQYDLESGNILTTVNMILDIINCADIFCLRIYIPTPVGENALILMPPAFQAVITPLP